MDLVISLERFKVIFVVYGGTGLGRAANLREVGAIAKTGEDLGQRSSDDGAWVASRMFLKGGISQKDHVVDRFAALVAFQFVEGNGSYRVPNEDVRHPLRLCPNRGYTTGIAPREDEYHRERREQRGGIPQRTRRGMDGGRDRDQEHGDRRDHG